jgi:hypothetical protein
VIVPADFINQFAFIMELQCSSCEVGSEFLNIILKKVIASNGKIKKR